MDLLPLGLVFQLLTRRIQTHTSITASSLWSVISGTPHGLTSPVGSQAGVCRKLA